MIFLNSDELSPEMSGLYRICYICLHTWIQKEIVRKKGRGSITKGIQSGHTPSHLLRKNYLRFLELTIRLNVKLYEMLRVLRRIKKKKAKYFNFSSFLEVFVCKSPTIKQNNIVCLNSNVTKVWNGHFKTISGHFFTTHIEIFHKI